MLQIELGPVKRAGQLRYWLCMLFAAVFVIGGIYFLIFGEKQDNAFGFFMLVILAPMMVAAAFFWRWLLSGE